MSDDTPPPKKSADGVWTQTALGSARPMTSETMKEVFGEHPDAGWKYVPSKSWPRKKRRQHISKSTDLEKVAKILLRQIVEERE